MEHLPELASVVRQVLGDDAAEPSAWTVAPVGYARMRGSDEILRVAGEARVPTGTRPFSAILKRVARPLRNGEPAPLACRPHGHSWRRELLAARSGLLDDPPGIRAPRCYTAVEEPDGSFRLWHQEVVEEHVGPWPVARYVSAARALGRFNGAYLVERPPPADDWLVRGRIGPPGGRVGSPGVSLALAAEAETWRRPLVARGYPPALAARLHRLALGDARRYHALEALPRALLHWDAYRANLISNHGDTYAIDWSCMGLGAPCEELGPLIVVSLLYFAVPAEDARELAEGCFDGYLTGLRDAGWRGDSSTLREAFRLALARWIPLAAGLYALCHPDPAAWIGQTWSRTVDEALAQWPHAAAQLLEVLSEP